MTMLSNNAVTVAEDDFLQTQNALPGPKENPEVEPEKTPNEDPGITPTTDPDRDDDDDDDDPLHEIEIGDDPDEERKKIPIM